MNTEKLNELEARIGQRPTSETLPLMVIDRLSYLYDQAGLTEMIGDFSKVIFSPLANDPLMSAVELDKRIIGDQKLAKNSPGYDDLFKLACAYSIEANRAGQLGDNEKAWMYASQGQYWMGFCNGARLVYGAGELALSAHARSIAAKRHGDTGSLQKLARKLAAEGHYKTRTEAAKGVYDRVLQKGIEDRVKSFLIEECDTPDKQSHFPDKTMRRVYDWLEGMNFGDGDEP